MLGLSLPLFQPAAAWYFLLLVYHFFALQGKKMIYKELNIIGKRKS